MDFRMTKVKLYFCIESNPQRSISFRRNGTGDTYGDTLAGGKRGFSIRSIGTAGMNFACGEEYQKRIRRTKLRSEPQLLWVIGQVLVGCCISKIKKNPTPRVTGEWGWKEWLVFRGRVTCGDGG